MKTRFEGRRIAAALTATLVTLGAAMSPASAQDAANGEKVFKKCKACHAIGEGAANKTGPELNGIIGRVAGSVEDYKYSGAMVESGLTWDEETLALFLAKPKDVVEGTKMSFAGLKKDSDIADVIAFLAQYNADGSMK